MSKAVLISIRPEWADRICYCGKTLEIRKTRPKLDTPFKCYINKTGKRDRHGVVGEFICDEVTRLTHVGSSRDDVRLVVEEDDGRIFDPEYIDLYYNSMLQSRQIEDYLHGGDGYAWHISKLVLYKYPKELSEFKPWSRECKYAELGLAIPNCNDCNGCKVERAPQSWCYVEEMQDG